MRSEKLADREGDMSGTRMSIAFYAFSPQGLTLGMKLARDMEGELFAPVRLLQTETENGVSFFGSEESGDRTFGDIAAREGTAGILPGQRVGYPVWPVRGFSSLSELMEEQFHSYPAHVFIGAAGIAVRAIAPHLRGKTVDPAVVVCEIHGRFVISMLSGHVGGANALTRNLAARTGGTAVVTTATDSEGLPALDVLADIAHCHVADPENLKLVTAAILAGRKPVLVDPRGLLPLSDEERSSLFIEEKSADSLEKEEAMPSPQVVVGVREVPPASGRLRLYARRLHLGMGWRRGVPAEVLLQGISETLKRAGLARDALSALATSDIKKEDPAVRAVAAQLGLPLLFFSADELASIPVPHPSEKASEILGREGISVAEGAALLSAVRGFGASAQDVPRLIVPKTGHETYTVAVALA